MSDWNARFLEMAALVGSWSKDPDHKVGAVVVDERRVVLGVGYNGFPRYVSDAPERYEDRLVKLKLIVHAEANAILNSSAALRGAYLYCTRFPCSDCAKLIIQSGITSIVSPDVSPDSRWSEDAEFSKKMMSEAFVSVRFA